MNNSLPLKASSPITVTTATNKTITLSWLPDIPDLFTPPTDDILAKWAIMILDLPEQPYDPGQGGFNYSELLLITGGNSRTGTLRYMSTSRNYPKWIGKRVALYNPFLNWEFKINPLIKKNDAWEWCKQYLAPAAMFRHTNGTHILLANGERNAHPTNRQSVGAFSSPDPWNVPFKIMNQAQPLFPEIRNSGDSFQVSSLIPAGDPGRWIAYGNLRVGDVWSIVAVLFDENLKFLKFFNHLLDPLPKAQAGHYFPSVIRYKGQYRMMWINRVSKFDKTRWTVFEGISDDAFGPFDYRPVKNNPVFKKVVRNDGIFRSNHTHQPTYFMENGSLFCLYDGTSRYKTSGNRGNRLFGIARYDDATEIWYEDERNPLFLNPMYGNKLWGPEWKWCSDHLGGKQFFYQVEDQPRMIFFSACHQCDSYRIACARLKRPLV